MNLQYTTSTMEFGEVPKQIILWRGLPYRYLGRLWRHRKAISHRRNSPTPTIHYQHDGRRRATSREAFLSHLGRLGSLKLSASNWPTIEILLLDVDDESSLRRRRSQLHHDEQILTRRRIELPTCQKLDIMDGGNLSDGGEVVGFSQVGGCNGARIQWTRLLRN